MSDPKGIKHILDYFGDSKMVILIGALCFVYFIFHWLPETKLMTKILPPMPGTIYGLLGLGVFIYQMITWRIFKLFQTGSMKNLKSWVLLFCEFCLLFFSVGFLCWPLYFISTFIQG